MSWKCCRTQGVFDSEKIKNSEAEAGCLFAVICLAPEFVWCDLVFFVELTT